MARQPSAAVRHILDAFLGNPFDVRPAIEQRGTRALANIDAAATLQQLLEADKLHLAKQLVLAIGHAQARDADTCNAILQPALLPARLTRRLPRRIAAYRRIAAAAGRGYRALQQVRGGSASLLDVRRATWAACFGNSLLHTLDLEEVIRDHDVLILGETGTGKEAFARAIQLATPGGNDGSAAPSSAINAAAIPDTLVESELFGHVKGAFTGANEARAGRLRSSSGGAFFLDEVGDLPMTTQVKLLRIIETDEVFPVGADHSHRVDVRYIAATHRDLYEMAETGEFRRDLLERLAGNVIRIPPLRDRPEDIEEIGLAFVGRYLGEATPGDAIVEFLSSPEARAYAWPGNVRELQNVLRNLLLGLAPGLHASTSLAVSAVPDNSSIPTAIREGSATLAAAESWYLRAVVERLGGNVTQASRTLDVDRSTVRRRLRES